MISSLHPNSDWWFVLLWLPSAEMGGSAVREPSISLCSSHCPSSAPMGGPRASPLSGRPSPPPSHVGRPLSCHTPNPTISEKVSAHPRLLRDKGLRVPMPILCPLLPALALGPIMPTPIQETGATLFQAFLRLSMKDPNSWEKCPALNPSPEGIWPKFPT